MSRVFASKDITAFAFARRSDDFFEGCVDVLFGPNASRVRHVCLDLRDTFADALCDARRDAMALIKMWPNDRMSSSNPSRRKVSRPG